MPKKFTPKTVLTNPNFSHYNQQKQATSPATDVDFSPFTDVIACLKNAELNASATSIAIIMEHSAKTHQLQTA